MKQHESLKKIRRNLIKRGVCLLIVLAMFFNCIPSDGETSPFFDIFRSTRRVFAAGGTYTLDSYVKIAEYCAEYDESHAEDTLIINMADAGSQGEITDYIPIGRDELSAFSGRIEVNTNMVFNLPCSMFDYIADDAVIVDQSGNPVTLTITRTRNVSDEPLFAKHVVSKRDSGMAEWSIHYSKYQIPDAAEATYNVYNFAGYIGSIDSDAKVSLTSIIHDNKASTVANIQGSGDIGLVCGSLGDGAVLEINRIYNTSSSEGSDDFTVRSTGGNAGGLVGRMGDGAHLILGSGLSNPQASGKAITSSKAYAGGIVGYNNGGTIEFNNTGAYSVNQNITGKTGAGGIAGYYSTVSSDSSTDRYTISTEDVSISSTKVNGEGNCGGLFGEVVNDGDMAISGSSAVTVNHNSGSANTLGGLIGQYSAADLKDSLALTLTGTVSPSRTANAKNYGGLIGSSDGSAYISIQGITVSSSGAAGTINFGGVIGRASDSFVDMSGTNKISYSGVSDSTTFGGVIGDLGNGVLYLQGTTDLSGAPGVTKATSSSGQVVGFRNSALAFAADGWHMIRPTGNQQLDDVGSWGEVVRFNSTTLRQSDVLTIDSTGHFVTVKPAVTSISNLTEFAKTALNFQHNNGLTTTGVLRGDSSSQSSSLKNTNISLSSSSVSIDLHGTGLTGLTRDSGDDCVVYSGTFNGNGGTIILATGESYDSQNKTHGNGTIYGHNYIGLFGKTSGATVQNLNIGSTSSVDVYAKVKMNVGSVIGDAAGNLILSEVEIKSGATVNHHGSSESFYGGIAGSLDNAGKVSITNCKTSGTITGDSTNSWIGGLIGNVRNSSTFGITISGTEVSGSIVSSGDSAKVGGTIGTITSTDNAPAHIGSSRRVTINDLKIDGLSMNITNSATSGGFLGYSWYETEVVFMSGSGVEVKGSSSLTADGNAAGLVYAATGYWNVNSDGIKMSSLSVNSSGTSFGLIVNKGYYKDSDETWGASSNKKSSALYLELGPSAFDVTKASVNLNLPSVTVFDELVAYSSMNGVLNNGQGIVSVNTFNGTDESSRLLRMGNDDLVNTGDTYKHKTEFLDNNAALRINPNTRYYYNLDSYRTTQSNAAKQLLIWSVDQYAHNSIQGYFTSTNRIGTDSSTDIDLRGYSYYPVDLNGDLTIHGQLHLYNKEFDETENTRKSYLPSQQSQHYMIHNSILRNVSGTLNASGVSLSGNVNKIDGYCGALVMGNVGSGSSANPATIDIDGLVLSGVKINNHNGAVAPLLINTASSNTNLEISNVSNDSSYASELGYIASNLIGDVGSSDAKNITVTFEGIKLDGRKPAGVAALSDLDSVYGTPNGSLFSMSTLLNSLAYASNSGSYGIYNYSLQEDWGEDGIWGGPRNVTYGAEIDATVENADSGVSKQQNYMGGWSNPYYTRPDSSANIGSKYNNFDSNFKPYVATGYSESNNTHELRVNIQGASGLSGCGTYNHPYLINDGKQIETLAKIINGTDHTIDELRVPNSVISGAKPHESWCDGQNSETPLTIYENGTWYPADRSVSNSISDDALRKYLAGAYYKIDPEITKDLTLSKDFEGFANDSNKMSAPFAFRGVIDGSGKTLINESGQPLIVSSNGSVIRDLKLVVKPESSAQTRTLKNSTAAFLYDNSCDAYGAVIAKIHGGDNVIDNVSVDYTDTSVKIIKKGTAANARLVPIGGYVGVVVNGGLFFRNMTGNAGDNQGGITKDNFEGFEGDPTSSDNTMWLYINPIVGRVLNGFVVTESSSYKPFEDGSRTYPNGDKEYWHGSSADGSSGGKIGVTMRNGTKNYSITDINTSADVFTMQKNGVTSGEDGSTVTVSNAQSLFIISLITESGLGTSSNGKYDNTNNILKPYKDYMATHLAAYDHVGENNIEITNSDYIKASADIHYTGTDMSNKVPYLIKNYTPEASNGTYPAFNLAAFEGVKNELYLKMAFSSSNDSKYYMPDGFRGLGSLMLQNGNSNWADSNRIYNAMFLSELNGNNTQISLNMSMSLYNSDNYTTPNANQAYIKTGYGFFGALRSTGGSATQNQIKDFSLVGSVKMDVLDNNGIAVYDKGSLNTNARPAVGGLVGAPGVDTNSDGGGGDMYIKNVSVDNLYVRGVRFTGGFMGCSNAAATYSFKNCSADNLQILGGTSTGGLIGYVRNASSKINADFGGNEFKIISLVSRSTWNDATGDNGSCAAGGLFGDDYSGNTTGITVKDVTIKNASSVDKGYIGYDNTVGGTDNKTAPKAGGVIGSVDRVQSNLARSNNVVLENVVVENIDISSKYSGGLIGYLYGNPSIVVTLDVNDCTVQTDKGASITNNVASGDDSGSGGIIGNCDVSDAGSLLKIENCKVLDYKIEGIRNCAGLVGKKIGSNNPNLICNNILVSAVDLVVNQQGGGLVGMLSNGNLLGYNILVKNVAINRKSGSGVPTVSGYVAGKNNKTIQLVGYSRQGTMTIENTVGSPTSDIYGADGYVIFADYNDTASEDGANVEFSNFDFDGKNIGENPARSKITKTVYKIVAVRSMEKNDITNNITVLGIASADVVSEDYGEYDPVIGHDQHLVSSGGYRFRYQYNKNSGTQLRKWTYNQATTGTSLRYVNGVILGPDDDANKYGAAVNDEISDYNNNCSSYLGTYKDDKNCEAVELFVITQEVKENVFYVANNRLPYVTTNPRADITSTQWLTSDGVSNTSYPDSAAQQIISDMRSASSSTPVAASLKRYQNTGISNTERDDLAGILSKNMLSIRDAVTSTDPYGGEDFPVLVIDDLTTANATVNNYLKLLTNTDYDFYNGYSDGTSYTGDDKTVYNLDISKWKYNSSSGEFEKQTGPASLKCEANTRFYINANEVDNMNWQISLIDVQFYDPANLPTFSGTSRTDSGLVAYHLYVPVVVKKMLHYTVAIRPSSGTTYNLDAYPSAVANLVENLGNPVTVKVTYTYRRDTEGWEDAINNGESVYRNYDKVLSVKAFGNTFPGDAIAVLVDPNGNADRFYNDNYSSTGILRYYGYDTGSSTYKLILGDSDGSTSGFDTCKLNDIMNIAIDDSAEDKNLVEWQTGDAEEIVAEINTGSGTGTKLRMKRSNETGDYAVKVTFPENQTDGSYLQENYYLSIFTKVDESDTGFYHYEVSSFGNTFNDPNYPSAKLAPNEAAHLIFGNLFTNEVSIESLNTNRLISSSNDTLSARITASVGFTPNAINNNIDSYISNDNVKIYQSFMVSLNKLNGSDSTNERGILVNPAEPIERTDYEVAGTGGLDGHLKPYKISDSYIELPSDYNIKGDLLDAVATYKSTGSGNTIDITETVDLRYLESTFGIQFPQADESSLNKGTYMIGYSNISSSPDNGAASHASSNTDAQEQGRLLYYIKDDSTVKFSYNATTNEDNHIDGNGNYGQLGLDGREFDKKGIEEGSVNTAIFYNIYDYGSKQVANYMKIKIELFSKSDGYSTALDIPTYLDDFKVYDKDDNEIVTGADNIISKPSNGAYTYIVPLSSLYQSSDDVYLIPIRFKPYSGNNSTFEGSTLDYANYKVQVTVGLLRTKSSSETVMTGSDAYDHVIYTNAKLISDIVEPH